VAQPQGAWDLFLIIVKYGAALVVGLGIVAAIIVLFAVVLDPDRDS